MIANTAPDLLRSAATAVRNGDAPAAIDLYRKALAIKPDAADAWFNLGWLYRATRRFPEALDAYKAAIDHRVNRPEEAWLNRATIHSDHLFDTAAAEAELKIALNLQPGFVSAWLNLGNLYEDLGRREDASAAYARTVAIDPANGRARARLAVIKLFSGDAAGAANDLERALGGVKTPPDRAEMLFALGSARDAEGKYEAAFQAYEAANQLERSLANHRYDPAAQERLTTRVIATYPRPLAAAAAVADQPTPIFICGMFRSGSTLAEQILERHPSITATGELEFIPALAQLRLNPYPEVCASLTQGQLDLLREEYLREVAPLGLSTPFFTDKRCDNFLHIGLIKQLFPEARIINTVRQPLDNLLSVYFLNFGEAVSYGNDLRDAAHYYTQYHRVMDHWRRLFPDAIVDLDYDQLVGAPQGAIEQVLSHLGLSWDDACLETRRAEGPVRTASAWQVRQALHQRSSGRWRNYARHLGPAQKILAAAGL